MSNNTLTRGKATRTQYLASLRSKIQEMSSPKGSQKSDDERYWKPEVDKAGTGSAVVRFLPARADEGFPFVQLHTHGFQGPTGKWFIDNCPTSIEGDCPACKANTDLWATGSEANKKLASSRKRKLNYISNILVINDPKHPEHNGKVFLYKYGKKIFEKIKDLIDPPAEFADMESVDPFSMEEGANFNLRIVRVDNFPNYDKSTFAATKSAIGGEDRIAEIETQLYSLNDILNVKNFKSYEDLNKRFISVTGGVVADEEAPAAEETSGGDNKPSLADDDMPVVKPKATAAAKPAAAKTTPKVTPKTAPTTTAAPADEEEDFFAKLAANAETN